MKTLCLIPVYNEDTKLIELINQIKKYKSKNNNVNYLFINNGSTDKSFYLIKKNKFKFINLKKNYGVGYALIVGYLHAKKNKYDSVIHLAGNGKMHPKYISKILKYLYVLNYDFVSGSRFLKNSTHKNNPLYRIILIKKEVELPTTTIRTCLNGNLVQDKDSITDTLEDLKYATNNKPSESELADLLFASKLCKNTKSNTIILEQKEEVESLESVFQQLTKNV